MSGMVMKRTALEKVFNVINIALMCVLVIVTFYPFWYTLIHSLNSAWDSMQGPLFLWPRDFTTVNYREVFRGEEITRGLVISVCRTVAGTILSVLFTSMFAYVLTHKRMTGRKLMFTLIIIPMYFSGGLVPFYLVCRELGLVNNYLVYLVPTMLSTFHIIIVHTYMNANVPMALEESAKIDGANELRIFFKIIFPTCMPILATIALFVGVAQWNDWFTGYIFMSKSSMWPIQTVLMRIIKRVKDHEEMTKMGLLNIVDYEKELRTRPSPQAMREAAIIISIIPIVMIYPFMQKYFIKGVMIGSIKE